jgi:hypothetical protein
MRIALVLFLLLCGGGVFAESNPPAPTPAKLSNPSQEQAKGNQGDPEVRPKFTPKSSCCPINQKQSTERTNKADNHPPIDWIPWLTLALVVIGAGQALIYKNQLTHFQRADRPYVFATVEYIKDKSTFNADGSCKLFIVAHFKNLGKTPAILKDIKVGAEIQRSSPPNKIPKQEIETQKIPDGFVVGASGEHTHNSIIEITAQDWSDIQQYTIWLTCFGVVRYMDTVSESVRETSFHWHYYPFQNQQKFFITSNDEWNYYT